MTNKFDYIIVGQGLAGTCLALHLQRLGQSVLIIDEDKSNSSSKVAAGLFNPITGRKMVLTWKATLLFDYLKNFYEEVEQVFKLKFLHETTIYRPFVSLEEQNEWMGKSTLTDYSVFIKKLHTNSLFGEHINDSFGGLMLKKCGYLDIPLFLSSSRQYFEKLKILKDEKFDFSKLQINGTVSYGAVKADKIIFCTGPESVSNPFFNWLPFNFVKGEVIEITPEYDFDVIYNRGVFIMPREEKKYVVGATYDTRDLTTNITEKAKNTLVEKLEAIFKLSYKITGQRAGIRPATRDRRPFVGMHPEMKQIGIFNGLGTKGVTLAPYYTNQFTNFLVDGEDVDNEVNISRYYSLYYH